MKRPQCDNERADNGGAYECREERVGVPLSYVREKLAVTLAAVHSANHRVEDDAPATPGVHAALRSAFRHAVLAYLALTNTLGDLSVDLFDELLSEGPDAFVSWIRRIDRRGALSRSSEVKRRRQR